MNITVTLSANAGVSIIFGGRRIWVDALHNRKEPGFSSVDGSLQKKMVNHPGFQSPEHIIFTHCHPDHYSKALTAVAVGLWPQASLYLPEQEFDNQTWIHGEKMDTEDGFLTFISLPHEGNQYSDVKHYGVLIHIHGRNILIAGDCATASPRLMDAIGNTRIDLALLNFPWLTLKKGREFIQTHLPEAKLLVYHLPFAPDDTNGYRQSAEKALQMLPTTDIRLLLEPLQTEMIEI